MASAKKIEIEPLPLHLKNLTHNDCADWCLVLLYQISAESDQYCMQWIDLKIWRVAPLEEIGEFDSERLGGLIVSSCQVWAQSDKNGRPWIDLKIARDCAPWRISKNPARSDRVDWCLVSFYQVSGQSYKNCTLWLDFKISRCAPPQRFLGWNRKIRDWATMRTNV